MKEKTVENQLRTSIANECLLPQPCEGRRPLGSGMLKPWQAYALAATATAVTLGLRIALTDQLRDRPTLIVFTIPIMLCAYVGGLGAGLLATALCFTGICYYLLPPTHSFRIAHAVDRWDLFFVVLAGVGISVLSEGLHRARRRADIATRDVQARVALVEAEALQRAIFNSVSFSSIATDERGVIQIFNVGAERMLGYTAAEVLNKLTPSDFFDPHELTARAHALSAEFKTRIAPGFEALVFKATRGIEDIYEVTTIRKDKSRYPAMLSVTALRDPHNTIIGYLLIGTDNTARKKADDALRKSEAQLQTIVENISEAIVVSDLNGQLLHFNHAALDMLGYASMEDGRRHFSELVNTHELSDMDGAAWTVDQWPLARILRGERLHDLEARMRRIGGRWERLYNFRGTLAYDTGGKPLMAVISFSDITERKQAESAALLLAAIVESSIDAVIAKDLNGIITSWNAAAERMFGYSADEIVGRPITLIIPPGHQNEEEQILSKIRRGERVEHFETQRLRKDGGLVDISVTVSPIRDSHGRIIGASKVARDITGRKQIENELRESEERFRLLVEGVHEYAIILLDAEGTVVSWNAGAERLKGYKSGEIIGRSFSVFYPPEDVAAGKPVMELKAALEQGRWEDEGWRVRADGTRFWANVLITALKDSAGNLRGFSKLTRDITDRKQAEEALFKAGALQRAIFYSANFSSIATDARGIIQIFNVGAERMLGYTAAEVMNKITPADISDPAEVIARARALSLELATPITPGFEALVFKASRGIEDIYELTYIRKDGSRFPAVVSVTALRDAQNAIIGYLLIGTDNTERKRASDVIRQLTAELEQRVVERTAQLQNANKELEAFCYSVSHDLRTPLRSLDGFSQALLEDSFEKLDAKGQDYLRRIRAASQRMGQLIDDLLNLSRVSRGEMTRELVDVSKMAHEVAEELRTTAPQRDAEFVVAEGLVAKTDPRLLRIVLVNLLGNAWKFTAKQAHTRIEFGSTGENGNTEYFTRDNGAGFDEAYSSKLFGAFQRLHSAKDFAGTGIGLATVQRIIQRQGGRVWAEGKVDQGATFHFTL
jgi:PAS domain S-box-containing protein